MLARAHARAPILAHRHSPKTWNRSTATARRATTRGRRVVCSASDAEPAGETIVASSVSGGSLDDPLANFRDGDLLLLRVDGSEEDDATKLASKPLLDREWFFEVVGDEAQLSQTTPSVQETDEASVQETDEARPHETRRSLVGLCRGVAAFLTWSAEDGEIRMVPVAERDVGERSRCSPRLAEREWVKASFPAWHALLSDLESTGEYPRDPRSVLRSFRDGSIDKSSIARVEKVTDYDALRSTVRADPSYWCDGAPAEFVETDPKRQATNNAGELLALLEGHRGVVMTQLWAGWEDSDSQQPVDAPFALRALRECAGDARVAIVPASVPGMPARKGLTAIMSAAESPFLEQAKHLASFGAQAALVKLVPPTISTSRAGYISCLGEIVGAPRLMKHPGTGKCKGIGWITFATAAGQAAALGWDGCAYGGRHLSVTAAIAQHSGIRPSLQAPGTHTPAMLRETLDALVRSDPRGVYVDGTFGRGGHSRGILAALAPEGRLHAFDMDPEVRDKQRFFPAVVFFLSRFSLSKLFRVNYPAFVSAFFPLRRARVLSSAAHDAMRIPPSLENSFGWSTPAWRRTYHP